MSSGLTLIGSCAVGLVIGWSCARVLAVELKTMRAVAVLLAPLVAAIEVRWLVGTWDCAYALVSASAIALVAYCLFCAWLERKMISVAASQKSI